MQSNIAGILLGVSVIMLGFCNNIPMLGVFIFLYGVVEGGYHSQRMTILGEFLTKQEIADGVGWSICVMGIGSFISTTSLGMEQVINLSESIMFSWFWQVLS